LRGCLNLTKRLIGTTLAFDLSLLMRHLHGVGTPKQWEARAQRALLSATDWLGRAYNLVWRRIVHLSGYSRYSRRNYANFGRGKISTHRSNSGIFNRLLGAELEKAIS